MLGFAEVRIFAYLRSLHSSHPSPILLGPAGTSIRDHCGRRSEAAKEPDFRMGFLNSLMPVFCSTQPHRPDPVLVCPTLAAGGHVPRGARPPRGGNAAPMVGQRHRTHDALPARPVLLGHPARSASDAASTPGCRDQRLVSQAPPNLLRYARRRAPRVLARTGFRHVPPNIEHAETPTGTPRRHHIRALQCRLMAKVELRHAGTG